MTGAFTSSDSSRIRNKEGGVKPVCGSPRIDVLHGRGPSERLRLASVRTDGGVGTCRRAVRPSRTLRPQTVPSTSTSKVAVETKMTLNEGTRLLRLIRSESKKVDSLPRLLSMVSYYHTLYLLFYITSCTTRK